MLIYTREEQGIYYHLLSSAQMKIELIQNFMHDVCIKQ